MKIGPANVADLPDIRRLLERAHLIGDDLTAEALEHFLVLQEGNVLGGAVGLEAYGNVALLRSLVVAEELRGSGHGVALTTAAETLAKQLGIKSIYLLTTSAEKFFSSRGYRTVPRDQVPASIKGTSQFSALCPATAIVMVKA
jgi:amino-acid N-acetyltransferase